MQANGQNKKQAPLLVKVKKTCFVSLCDLKYTAFLQNGTTH